LAKPEYAHHSAPVLNPINVPIKLELADRQSFS